MLRRNTPKTPCSPRLGTWQGLEVRLELAAHRADHVLTDLRERKAAELSEGRLVRIPWVKASAGLSLCCGCWFYPLPNLLK